MIRMYEKQSAFTARQVLAVIIALILMSAFLPSRAAVAEDEPFIEIEDIEWKTFDLASANKASDKGKYNNGE